MLPLPLFFVLCPPHWVLARSEVNVNPGLLDVLTGGANFSWQVLTVLGPPKLIVGFS